MRDYEEKVIEFLKEKGDYNYGLLGYITDQYTTGELMRNSRIYDAVAEVYGPMFVEDTILDAVEDPDYPFAKDLEKMVPVEVWGGFESDPT